MRIPQEIIDRVRESTDIVALVGEQVRLTKAGRSYRGLCPFHTEKTPSFHVNPERQIYHCFGCGAGGNAITFLIEHSKMSFPEAVRHLAERAGITLPTMKDDPTEETDTARLSEALALAAEFFEERLAHPYAGQPARDYLARRGFTPELAREFGLGFAPPGWKNLLDVAGKRFTLDVLARAGLAVLKEDGSAYDRFRNRVMVPIRSIAGRVVGFGGRTLAEGDNDPKYINSPESPIYQKGQLLFGLSVARDELRKADTAILVEGYFDHLRLYGAGFRNVVAVAGTAFTPQQASLLKRHVSQVALVFDGDTAGLNAAWKGAGLCLGAGLEPRLAILPAGHDPDSLIRDEGPDAFRKALGQAESVVEFAAGRILPKAGREEAIRRLVDLIRECPDPIKRRLLVQSGAERLNFDEAVLVQAVEDRRPAVFARPPEPAPVLAAELPRVERTLLAILIDQPGILPDLGGVEPGDFEDERSRALFERILGMTPEGEIRHRLLETGAGTPLARVLSQVVDEPTHGGLEAALDCARALRTRRLNQEIMTLRTELASAERNREPARSQHLLERINELSHQKRILTTGA